MIPRINKQGFSFKGVTKYLMHDKGTLTNDRVEWSSTGNLFTDDIEKAALIMSWTDQNSNALKQDVGGSLSGRKVQNGSVYHYSLSWSPDEIPSKEHQQEQVLDSLEKIGLSENQFYMVAHNDTDHSHVHVVVNLTHPETGKRTDPHLDKKALQEWALDYEKEHGIYCEQRVKNAELRLGNKTQKYQNQKQDYSKKVTQAFISSDGGKAFVNALENENLYLGKSRRGNSFVIVDETGGIQKLSRQLDIEQKGKVKTAVIASKLSDMNLDLIPDADELSRTLKATHKTKLKNVNQTEDIIKPIDEPINTLITGSIDKEESLISGDMPVDVLDRLMGGSDVSETTLTTDDILDRLMETEINEVSEDFVNTSKFSKSPLYQSNPFSQSNPFEGKTHDLFGESGAIDEMMDAFKEELDTDSSLSDDDKEGIFNKVISKIEDLTENNSNITAELVEDIKKNVLHQEKGKGR